MSKKEHLAGGWEEEEKHRVSEEKHRLALTGEHVKREREEEGEHQRLKEEEEKARAFSGGDLAPGEQAITVGGTIVATTTIDAIMTSLWATRSADLSATPVYTWAANSPPTLTASWPAANTVQGQCAQIIARFEIRPVAPSTIAP